MPYSRKNKSKKYYWIIVTCFVIQFFCWILVQDAAWVEQYYAQAFYPIFSYLPKFLLDWVPFSIGDVCYIGVVLYILYLLFAVFKQLYKRNWNLLGYKILQLTALLLLIYNFFYVSWGLNYFRQPLSTHFELEVDSISKEDYYLALDEIVLRTNELREALNNDTLNPEGVRFDMQTLMKEDTVFERMLSKTQVRGKAPISSTLISYFMVTGYFNPFTHEVHVNQEVPLITYPFTTVHELVHQMGVGFEDECNFIAFQILHKHPNTWYAYSAYYEALQYFLFPVRYEDPKRFEQYLSCIHPKVREDLENDRAFWAQYHGWIHTLSSMLYDNYLEHNNQPEGSIRYSMMNRLIVAWNNKYEKKLYE